MRWDEYFCKRSIIGGRLILTDAQWARIEPLCTGKANDREPTADNRLFPIYRNRAVDSPHRQSVAGFTQGIWQMEQRVPALPPLGQSRALCQNL